jgi:hypothetical protein
VNAERLHAIVNALKEEMTKAETTSLVQALRDNLQQVVASSNAPGPQQEASRIRAELNDKLSRAPSNEFSPAWREALDELGIADLVGDGLREQIEEIFTQNEITPSAAVSELDPVVERVQQLQSALENVDNGLSFFGIGADRLDPGDIEIGFLIPRDAVKDELEELGKEFIKLQQILGPFLEVATGSREGLRVRSISSSAFGAFLQSYPAAALLIATAVERLIASYKNIMDIRVAQQTLKESGLTDKALKSIADEVETKISRDIKAIVTEVLKEASGIDKGRRNELRKELTVSLNAMANRIDRGYNIEIRVEEIEPSADEEDEKSMSAEERAQRDIVDKIRAKQENLKFANVTGQPILALPESTTGTSTGTKRSSGERSQTASPPRRTRTKRPPSDE